MNSIFDSCFTSLEFGDGFGLGSKFVGVPRIYRNGNDVEILEILSIIS